MTRVVLEAVGLAAGMCLPFVGNRIPIILQVIGYLLFVALLFFVVFLPVRKRGEGRLRVLSDGIGLLYIFMICLCICIPAFLCALIWQHWVNVLVGALVVIVVEAVLFWSGMLRIFFTSVQLALKWRILAVAVGWVPGLNVYVLWRMCRICEKEVQLELTLTTSDVCKSKYPIVFVHGVFFRDVDWACYWGRIPDALERNGAQVFFGRQQSALPVKESAEELVKTVEEVLAQTGCEKVHIIAHSKGGLDARYAISVLGLDKKVKSLTTVNTPHRGCLFAEYLLNKAPEKLRTKIAAAYEAALRKFGDTAPDFLGAVEDLTNSRCVQLSEQMPDKEGVYYQSVGSAQVPRFFRRKFPFNLSYPFVKRFDGENDGLVAVTSMKWGERFIFAQTHGKRGLSHADMVDLARENIDGFDVRRFYIDLVRDLKDRFG